MVKNNKYIVTSEVSFSTIFGETKKGISPVVATALLLVVAVVAVVGYSHSTLLRSIHFEQVQRVSKLVWGELNV